MDEAILKREEKAVYALRALYHKFGYAPYRMSKFEEYEYYIRNKDFLLSDRIITFNDTNGKLLALKPDVTLSIIKNGEDQPGCKQKVYYDENIYRISERTGQYKELTQAGLECIGDLDLYDIYEAVMLATESLSLLSADFLLQISHLGVISAMLDLASADPEFQQEALRLIGEKNEHDLRRLCQKSGISEKNAERLAAFISVYGNRTDVLAWLDENCSDVAAVEELKALSALLDRLPCSSKIIFDFSVVNNRNYYNGIVFTGFLSGISDSVLAGGQYDKMMQKLNRKSKAVGFAVYLDLLEQLPVPKQDYDVDVLLLYPEDLSCGELACAVEALVQEGKTVCTQKAIPARLRYREIIRLEGVKC